MMDEEQIAAMRFATGIEEEELPVGHGLKLNMKWRPRLNKTQQRLYETKATFILAYGERGTGKSIGGLHKIVEHCVNNRNAFALIIVREVGQATEGGAWSKLLKDILPQWQNGNFDRRTQVRLDNGCGIDFTLPKQDPYDKKPYVWVSNKFGGWSQIKLISLFVGEHVSGKVKGKEPSAIMFDEAQTTDDESYFGDIVQQLGRHPDVPGANQFILYSANPKGPSHWLYKRFFVGEYDVDGEAMEWPIDEVTGHPMLPDGTANTRYAVFHVPIAENVHNLQPGYWENVLEAVKNDQVEYDRMVLGLWVDKPEGDAIFAEDWNDADHLRGDLVRQIGIIPLPGYPLIISWDPGAAHTSVHFMQLVPTIDKLIWVVPDEKNYVGKYMPYRRLVPEIIKRMQYWEEESGRVYGKAVEFKFIHVSDDSAFNQFRAKEGSFDAQDIENISREYVAANKLPDRFIIRMRAAPKGAHSIEQRVRITKDALVEKCVIVSATCTKTRAMFMSLECDKGDRMKPKRSAHIHSFDSFSYTLIYFNSGAGRLATKAQLEPPRKQEFYRVGGKVTL